MARLGGRTRHPQDAHMWSGCRLSVCYERPCHYATSKREKFPSPHVRLRQEKAAYRVNLALWKGQGWASDKGRCAWLTSEKGTGCVHTPGSVTELGAWAGTAIYRSERPLWVGLTRSTHDRRTTGFGATPSPRRSAAKDRSPPQRKSRLKRYAWVPAVNSNTPESGK